VAGIGGQPWLSVVVAGLAPCMHFAALKYGKSIFLCGVPGEWRRLGLHLCCNLSPCVGHRT